MIPRLLASAALLAALDAAEHALDAAVALSWRAGLVAVRGSLAVRRWRSRVDAWGRLTVEVPQ